MEVISYFDDAIPRELDPSFKIHHLFQEKNKAFTLFNRIQGAMRYLPNFVKTCKAILVVVIDEMDAENCSVMLKDPISGELSLLAAQGKNDGSSGNFPDASAKVNRSKLKEGIVGWVLKEGRAVMVNDVNEDSRFIRAPGLNNRVRSLICFPIREHDQFIGVFNLSHSRKGAFDEGDRLAMAYVANQIGAALTSARFFKEIQGTKCLARNSGDSFGKAKVVPISIPCPPTLVEVEEMTPGNGSFIYTSGKMHRIKEVVDQVANTDVTILIQGESGVGKEVVARSIHLTSLRRDKPFVKVNCAALPQELLESELFGYEKGAFTGAYRQKPGKFELANGGTIFLDEIAEISPSLQAKLLQVLQDREFSRLGGKRDVKVDARVLAATNRNIEEAVNTGRFREDLYYRLNVVNVTIPPLRERKEEIPIFVEYFLDKFGKKYNKMIKPLPDHMMKAFLKYQWLGNIRELENMIQRFVVLGNEEVVLEELASTAEKDSNKATKETNSDKKAWPSLKEVHREATIKAEAEVIRKTLELTNWNRKKASHLLNISYKALLYKIKEYGIHERADLISPQ